MVSVSKIFYFNVLTLFISTLELTKYQMRYIDEHEWRSGKELEGGGCDLDWEDRKIIRNLTQNIQ
jgi:hypothetical protein